MNRTRISALLVSALIQIAPLVRVAVTESVAVTSPLVAVLRWFAGAAAMAGAFHGVSAASGMTIQQGGTVVATPKGVSGTVIAGVRVSMFSNFGTPRSYFFTDLPPGLSGSLQGVITGIPNTPGSFEVTVIGWELPGGGGNNYLSTFVFSVAPEALPDPPGISVPPQSITLAAGASLSLSAVVTGSGLTYQWRKDGAEIPGPAGTAAVYSVGSVQLVDAGRYTVLVTNAGGSVESSAAVVTVVSPPVFSVPLQSQTVAAGAPVTFSASVVGTSLTFQWFKGPNPIPAPGGTGPTLSIPSAQAVDAGVYSLTVSNLGGSVSSGDATLTVLTSPVFQFPLVSRTVIQGTPISLAAAVIGDGLVYQWFKDEVAIPAPKGTSPTLDLGAVTAADAGSYRLTISNAAGSASTGPATLVVVTPPVITTQPQAVSLAVGAAAQLRVEATGETLTYQWSKDTAPIPAPAGTAPVLGFDPAKPSDAGSYVVTVSNAAGAATSVAVQVTVIVAPEITVQPVPVSVKVGAPIALTGAASGVGLSFQWFKGTVALPEETGTAPSLSIAAASLSDAGEYVLRVTNVAGVASTLPVTVSVAPSVLLPSLLANLVGGTAYEDESVTFTARISTSDAVTYRWTRDGIVVPGETAPTLVIRSATAADAGSYRVEVTAGGATGTSASLDLSVVPAPVVSLSVSSPGQAGTLTWNSLPDRSYLVEVSLSLSGTDWTAVTTVTAESATAQASVPIGETSVRFVRVRPVPVVL